MGDKMRGWEGDRRQYVYVGDWEARRQERQEAGGGMGRVARDSGSWGVGRLRGAKAGDMGGEGQRLGR